MLVRTVKLSSRGRITLPVDALRALNADKGTEFLLLQEGDRIVLVKAEEAGRAIVDDQVGWAAFAAPAFEELWANEDDEIWDSA